MFEEKVLRFGNSYTELVWRSSKNIISKIILDQDQQIYYSDNAKYGLYGGCIRISYATFHPTWY